jgi:hypothetical protein
MTAAPDDLSALFAGAPAAPSQAMRYRQGILKSWDPVTAANTVLVGATLLSDLPILNSSDVLLLQVDDPVAVVVIGAEDSGARTHAILGRLTIPA